MRREEIVKIIGERIVKYSTLSISKELADRLDRLVGLMRANGEKVTKKDFVEKALKEAMEREEKRLKGEGS